MKGKIRFMAMILTVVIMSFAVLSLQAAAAEVKITGVVTDDYQILTDEGTVYDVADTEVGNEMLGHVSRKVEIVATVGGDEEIKVLTVLSFKVLEDE